jgi:hypothetical protein
MMSQRSKKEVLERIRARYLKASKAEKGIILDELTATTGYNRKYAIRVLRHPRQSKGLKKAGRKRRYSQEAVRQGVCNPFCPNGYANWKSAGRSV